MGRQQVRYSAYRLVVPSTFFPVLLAEHTTTSLLSFKFGLDIQLAKLFLAELLVLSVVVVMLLLVLQADSPHDVLDNVQGELPHAGPAKLLDNPGLAAIVRGGGIEQYGRGIREPICSPGRTHPPQSKNTARSRGARGELWLQEKGT